MRHHLWNAKMRIPLSSVKVMGIKPGMAWRVHFFCAAGRGLDPQRDSLLGHDSAGRQRFRPQPLGILRLSLVLLARPFSAPTQWMYAAGRRIVLATFLARSPVLDISGLTSGSGAILMPGGTSAMAAAKGVPIIWRGDRRNLSLREPVANRLATSASDHLEIRPPNQRRL